MTFKTYRATKKNVELLHKAMIELGKEIEEFVKDDYDSFRYFNWFFAGYEDINFKMQELEKTV